MPNLSAPVADVIGPVLASGLSGYAVALLAVALARKFFRKGGAR